MQDDVKTNAENNNVQDRTQYQPQEQPQEQTSTQDTQKERQEKEIQTRRTVDHSRAVYHQKLEDALKSFEEILRIIHATNWRNQNLVKRSVIELELVTKNAIMSLKGL